MEAHSTVVDCEQYCIMPCKQSQIEGLPVGLCQAGERWASSVLHQIKQC